MIEFIVGFVIGVVAILFKDKILAKIKEVKDKILGVSASDDESLPPKV